MELEVRQLEAMRKTILTAGALTSTSGVFAHGGHSTMESNLWHYVSSPDHLLLAVLLALGAVLVFRNRITRVLDQSNKT